MPVRVFAFALLLLSFLPNAAARAEPLRADQLLLVVNKNEPVGRELAQHYAAAREVPDHRIVEVDLPVRDDVDRDVYETDVVEPLRLFLTENGLKDQVRCIVTFYGMPLRVGPWKPDPDERAEIKATDGLAKETLEAFLMPLERVIATAEAAGGKVPGKVDLVPPLEAAVVRFQLANEFLRVRGQTLPASEQMALSRSINDIQSLLRKPVDDQGGPLSPAEVESLRVAATRVEDAEQRKIVRELILRAPLIDAAQVLASQQRFVSTKSTAAALDSELATLWSDSTPLRLWSANPLRQRMAFGEAAGWPLMTCRLDGPTPQIVRDAIANSLLAERDGLTGKVVIDSRGIRKNDGYGQFDEKLRQLASALRSDPKIDLVFDEQGDILLTEDGKPSVDDVAVYIGWYRVRKYEPALAFNRGAVGIHVASYEAVSLRGDGERGWVQGLQRDGVVATMGAVAEPYLSAFPSPEVFIPALLKGEGTLADVYWSTVPQVSWQLILIGDPLYQPFGSD